MKITPIDKAQFTDLILHMKIGESIVFATKCWNEYTEVIEERYVYDWYFATKLFLPDFDSCFVLCDYCGGGGDAFAISFNSYMNAPDEDDLYIVPQLVTDLFKRLHIGAQGRVYLQEV